MHISSKDKKKTKKKNNVPLVQLLVECTNINRRKHLCEFVCVCVYFNKIQSEYENKKQNQKQKK